MNGESYATALWLVIVWPLLLAIPALHSRLPLPRHLAIIPAVVLISLPADISLILPWLLFQTELAFTEEVRWLLLMSVAIWLTAATMTKPSRNDPDESRSTTFFLLTMTGNLGVILVTDLVGFFSFSTLMGYSLYGLLIQGGDVEVRRAGRLYLMFLIIADLLLFEALLLAAFSSETMQFDAVRDAMTGATASQLYVWLIVIGFSLKAAVWPTHLWLLVIFNSARPATTLLLGGVPIAMALFGAVRYLPLGQQNFDVLGLTLTIFGVTIMLYAVFRLFTGKHPKRLPGWSSVAITGLFVTTLGAGLSDPVLWRAYEHFVYPFIATTGILLAVLIIATLQSQMTEDSSVSVFKHANSFNLWIKPWISMLQRWSMDSLLLAQSVRHSSWDIPQKQYQRISDRKPSGRFFNGWPAKITLFVLLGLALAWLAV